LEPPEIDHREENEEALISEPRKAVYLIASSQHERNLSWQFCGLPKILVSVISVRCLEIVVLLLIHLARLGGVVECFGEVDSAERELA